MKSGKQYIVVLLLGIFLFPIAYKALHTLQHQSMAKLCSSHSCCASQSPQSSDDTTRLLEHTEEHCPICDYHFAINDLPPAVKVEAHSPRFECLSLQVDLRTPEQQTLRSKSSRAPPSLIF